MTKIRFSNGSEIDTPLIGAIPRHDQHQLDRESITRAGLYMVPGSGSWYEYYDSVNWLREGQDFDLVDREEHFLNYVNGPGQQIICDHLGYPGPDDPCPCGLTVGIKPKWNTKENK